MAEVFEQFADALLGSDGVRYRAQACGSEMPDGKWQGWLEFMPLDGATPVGSGRETTQPNRKDLAYWASGLTRVYLEGALERALNPLITRTTTRAEPVFDGPAPKKYAQDSSAPEREAVLDPFSVYDKGEALLRNQLQAMSSWHLVNIIEKYRLSDDPPTALNRLSAPVLVETIVAAVARERA